MKYDYWSTKPATRDLEQARVNLAANPGRRYLELREGVNECIAQQRELLERFEVHPEEQPAAGVLPWGGLYVSFVITLAGPYLSRDDRVFHLIHENPVRREWAFWVPMVAASTWKGNVRAGARTLVQTKENKAEWGSRLEQLLGTEPPEGGAEDADGLRQGRVQFFPTYFSAVDLDVLNPQNRTKRVGTVPILLERVPEGQKGRFGFYYIPYDLGHREDREVERKRDLRLLGTAIAAMFVEVGFGAKKTIANHGTVVDNVEGMVMADDRGPLELKEPWPVVAELWRLPELAQRSGE